MSLGQPNVLSPQNGKVQMALVSVIVPVFKVESFIERCARSLFEQTLERVQFIFIDDGSPDDSLKILTAVINDYPDRAAWVTILTHKTNKGLPSARNSGLNAANGDFVFHCDSDDRLAVTALREMYDHAIRNDSDIVWCDWYLSFKAGKRYMKQAPRTQSEELQPIDCIRMMLDGSIKYNVWNKLVKRSLYQENSVHFPDRYGMGEDMTMIKLFSFANKVSYLPKALYYYTQDNQNAFTKSKGVKFSSQIRYNADHIINFLEERYDETFRETIQFFKLIVKLPFLITDDEEMYRMWLKWYPESNHYINQNPAFSKRIKLVQKAALCEQFWFLKLYYRVVVCGLSKIVYK